MINPSNRGTMPDASTSRTGLAGVAVGWIATGSWILACPIETTTTTSLAPTASAHSACATAAYSIYITATSHALAALHRIVALIADLFNREVTRALSLRYLTTPATGEALAALPLIVALTAVLLIIEAASAIYIFCCGSKTSELGHILALFLTCAPFAMTCEGLLTRKATFLFNVSLICTVCNTVAVIKPLRRVHLHLGLCPRRKVR